MSKPEHPQTWKYLGESLPYAMSVPGGVVLRDCQAIGDGHSLALCFVGGVEIIQDRWDRNILAHIMFEDEEPEDEEEATL
jgi:hypothetical protein